MNQESKNIDSTNPESTNEQLNGRRDFIKKFGKYGVATPVAITTLMAAGPKTAAASGGCNPCELIDKFPIGNPLDLIQ